MVMCPIPMALVKGPRDTSRPKSVGWVDWAGLACLFGRPWGKMSASWRPKS